MGIRKRREFQTRTEIETLVLCVQPNTSHRPDNYQCLSFDLHDGPCWDSPQVTQSVHGSGYKSLTLGQDRNNLEAAGGGGRMDALPWKAGGWME